MPIAMMAAAPPAAVQEIKEPDWLKKPDFRAIAAVWPGDLKGSKGEAVIHCRVNVRGLLEACAIVSEKPEGMGVGAAALLLAPNFQMRPAMQDGHPVVGGVNIPVRFVSEGGPPDGTRIQSVVRPYWVKAPSSAQVAAAAPKVASGTVGHAALRCEVHPDGTLARCDVLTENPVYMGFGAAAKSLARYFQLYIDPDAPFPKRLQVTLPLAFLPAAEGPRYITAPAWSKRPSGEQSAAIFPAKAAKDGLNTGRATVDCVVRPDGSLGDCKAVGEEPAGEGFAEAGLLLAGSMAVGPWTQDGQPTDGAHLRIPIRLNAAASPPAR